MSVRVIFSCGGCRAEAEGRIVRRSEPVFGGDSGWCRVVTDSLDDAAPEGWIVFDPYTFQTYCPTCWASIIEPEPEVVSA